MTLRLELPYPDPRLSPNARVHYYTLNRAKAEAKEQVLVALLEQARWKIGKWYKRKPLDRATVTVTFIVGDKKRRDHGNAIASAKAYIDGLVDAGVIIDDNSKVITEVYPPMVYEKGVKKTIIEVAP